MLYDPYNHENGETSRMTKGDALTKSPEKRRSLREKRETSTPSTIRRCNRRWNCKHHFGQRMQNPQKHFDSIFTNVLNTGIPCIPSVHESQRRVIHERFAFHDCYTYRTQHGLYIVQYSSLCMIEARCVNESTYFFYQS